MTAAAVAGISDIDVANGAGSIAGSNAVFALVRSIGSNWLDAAMANLSRRRQSTSRFA